MTLLKYNLCNLLPLHNIHTCPMLSYQVAKHTCSRIYRQIQDHNTHCLPLSNVIGALAYRKHLFHHAYVEGDDNLCTYPSLYIESYLNHLDLHKKGRNISYYHNTSQYNPHLHKYDNPLAIPSDFHYRTAHVKYAMLLRGCSAAHHPSQGPHPGCYCQQDQLRKSSNYKHRIVEKKRLVSHKSPLP